MKTTKEQFLKYGRNLLEKDKEELINHWLSCPENGYLGSSYGKPNTLDKSIFREKCTIDLPWLSPEEIEDIVESTTEKI